MAVKDKIKILFDLFSLPKVDIVFAPRNDEDNNLYRNFTKPHPRYKIFANKAIGVALIKLRDFSSREEFTKTISGKNSPAYYSRRCIKEGYTFKKIDPNTLQQSILTINSSVSERQGQVMEDSYKRTLNYPSDNKNEYFGVFKGEELVAYLWFRFQGEFVIINRILGHNDHLRNGIMYLLLASGIDYLLNDRKGETNFIMYDTFFGATEGLRLFKKRFGFKPYIVRWKK